MNTNKQNNGLDNIVVEDENKTEDIVQTPEVKTEDVVQTPETVEMVDIVTTPEVKTEDVVQTPTKPKKSKKNNASKIMEQFRKELDAIKEENESLKKQIGQASIIIDEDGNGEVSFTDGEKPNTSIKYGIELSKISNPIQGAKYLEARIKNNDEVVPVRWSKHYSKVRGAYSAIMFNHVQYNFSLGYITYVLKEHEGLVHDWIEEKHRVTGSDLTEFEKVEKAIITTK